MENFAFCRSCGINRSVVADRDGTAPCPTCGATLAVAPGEDVFISYSHKDGAFARRLSATLWAAGVPNWLAETSLEPGADFAHGIVQALNLAKLVVLLLTPEAVASPWVHNELVYATNARLDIIGVRLKNFVLPDAIACMLASRLRVDVFDQPDELALDDLCRRVHGKLLAIAAAGTPSVPVAEPAPSPMPLRGVRHGEDRYVGPGPYRRTQAPLFFGRDAIARDILTTLHDHSIALYAPSGAGKSSLIHAKIRSNLEAAGWEVLIGGRMGLELPHDLAGSITNCFSYLVNRGLTGPEPPDPGRSVADQLHAMARYGSSGWRVLILDQFEEFFTRDDEREHRPRFFADLVSALAADPKLRLIVSFRQEFLANFEELTERADGLFDRVPLKRMTDAEACEVITRPVASYVTFAPGVAQQIVKLLRSRLKRNPDGTVERKRADFIELVHLQIVCQKLWTSLEEGLTEIRIEHLDRAAGDGKTFETFVENVLQDFVDRTVKKVARATRTAPELIHLGLLKFITRTGGRVTLPMDGRRERTARLPSEVVQQLAAEHLLRAEVRGDEQWYELSHDLLVEPVAQYRDPKLARLLALTDILGTRLDQAREDAERRGGGLTGYFRVHDDLLEECERVYDPQLLNAEDEAELVFRASLASGHKLGDWSSRLGAAFPEMRERVLRDALRASEPLVPSNAVKLIGKMFRKTAPPGDRALGRALAPEFVPVAAHPAEPVREAAAVSLAEVNDPALYGAVIDSLRAGSAPRSTAVLAAVLAEAESHGVTSHVAPFATLPRRARGSVRRASQRLRLRRDLPSVAYVIVSAAILSGLGAGLFKWLPTVLDVGITQPSGNVIMGLYQGFVAGALWGALISFALSVHHIVSPHANTESYHRPALAIPLGILSGALSGFLVDIIILSVYQAPTLTAMQWISGSDVKGPWRLLTEVYLQSRFGWCFIITGSLLGGSLSLVSNKLRRSEAWLTFLEQQTELTGLRQAAIVMRRIARLALFRAWPIPVALIAAIPLATLPVRPFHADAPSTRQAAADGPCLQASRPGSPSPDPRCRAMPSSVRSSDLADLEQSSLVDVRLPAPSRTEPERCAALAIRRSPGVWWDVAADCGCQVTGGFAVIVGIGFGLVLIRRGIHISPPRHSGGAVAPLGAQAARVA